MRLVDLNPRWMTNEGRVVGVTFDCPGACCAALRSIKDTEGESPLVKSRACVPFRIGLDGAPTPWGDKGWERDGDTFETLTLRPSVWISPPQHWHGFIHSGEAVNA